MRARGSITGRGRRWGAACACAAALGVAGVFWALIGDEGRHAARQMLASWGLQAQAETPTRLAESSAALRPVLSEIMAHGAQDIRAFPGLIVAMTEVDLGFQTAGRIATREVSVGDTVRKDMVLATLDQVTLEQDVEAAQAGLNAAQAAAHLAGQSLERVQELARRGVAAPAQLEAARAQADATSAQLVAAQADLSRARDAAQFAVLRAPMDGIIIATQAEEGMGVAAGTVVVTLATKAGREAVIDVPSEMIGLLPQGARFTVRRRAETHLRFPAPISGRLRLIEPVADANTRARRLRVTLENAGEDLRLGSLVTAELVSAAHPVLTVPRNAIVSDPADLEAAGATGVNGPIVWRITGTPRHVEAVTVTLADQIDAAVASDGPAQSTLDGAARAPHPELFDAPISEPHLAGRVIVVAGLRAGDEILTHGVHSVHQGMVIGERAE